jgi:hypothetical protein
MPSDIVYDEKCKNFTNGTINYNCIIHSKSVLKASMAVAKAELGDKTFLLLIIFTSAWSTWHLAYTHD